MQWFYCVCFCQKLKNTYVLLIIYHPCNTHVLHVDIDFSWCIILWHLEIMISGWRGSPQSRSGKTQRLTSLLEARISDLTSQVILMQTQTMWRRRNPLRWTPVMTTVTMSTLIWMNPLIFGCYNFFTPFDYGIFGCYHFCCNFFYHFLLLFPSFLL
jgi:hypothetical protein